jgi:drug/metabolite transporter (DMT)-like permease
MNVMQVAGVVSLVLGVVLLGFAYQSSNAPVDQLTDQTMTYLFLGVSAVVGGGLLALFARRPT